MTYDIDAVIIASSAMKEAINRVGDKLGLPHGWLNADFTRTGSYSTKLLEVSVYYKTYSNVLQIRTVSAEYLIAMKLMSGRRYKNDISDIYGILWEHQRNGTLITKDSIEKAVAVLYDGLDKLPEKSRLLLEKAFADGDFESLYNQSREDEKEAKEILVVFEEEYPNTLKTENIDSILDEMKRKRDAAQKKESDPALETQTRESGYNAFMALRKEAKDNGIQGMSLDEINNEINAARQEKETDD
jgi:hypothetical protein